VVYSGGVERSSVSNRGGHFVLRSVHCSYRSSGAVSVAGPNLLDFRGDRLVGRGYGKTRAGTAKRRSIAAGRRSTLGRGSYIEQKAGYDGHGSVVRAVPCR